MSQPPQPPPPGTVVNGHQWDGRQWVPLPQVGQVVNGHQWDGRQWVPLSPSSPGVTVATGQGRPAPWAHDRVLRELQRLAQAWQFEWRQRSDQVTLRRVVAEQKAFLSSSRLEYRARIRVDDARRELGFNELFRESTVGLSGDDDDDTPSGFGVQRTSYNTRTDATRDSIDEQAAQYRARYPLDFRYDLVSQQVRGIAEAAGHAFRYGALS